MSSHLAYAPADADRFVVTHDGELIGTVWDDGSGWVAETTAGTLVLPVVGSPRWLSQSGAGLALLCFVLDVKGHL